MGEVITIDLDNARAVFKVRKSIKRSRMLEFFAAVPRCLVGIEACPSAHRRRRHGRYPLCQEAWHEEAT
jgi:transposase